MVTHSSILAWRIPWAEEPGGLQSKGSQTWRRLKQLKHTRMHREAFSHITGHFWECLHSKTSQRYTGPLQG